MQKVSLNEIVEYAMNIEENGYNFYNAALTRKDLTPSMREIITHLRDEEIGHKKYFASLRDSEDLAEIMDPDGWEMVSAYLDSMVKSSMFSNNDDPIKKATEAKTEFDILRYAAQFEKQTLLFFNAILFKTNSKKANKALMIIIEEEMRHLKAIEDLM